MNGIQESQLPESQSRFIPSPASCRGLVGSLALLGFGISRHRLLDLVQPVAPPLSGSRANVLCGATAFADNETLPFPP